MNGELQKLQKQVDQIEKSLASVKKTLANMSNSETDYSTMPGVEGKFDGQFMVTAEGEKHEVPSNYAVKSRIMYGDTLKLIEEDGKQVFKILNKQKRKKVEGITTKKDGKICVLATTGSYKLSPTAVEFNNLDVNQKVVVFVPEGNTNVPYAAFDAVIDDSKTEDSKEKPKNIQEKKSQKKLEVINESTRSEPLKAEEVKEESQKKVNDDSKQKKSEQNDSNKPKQQDDSQKDSQKNSQDDTQKEDTLRVVEDFDLR